MLGEMKRGKTSNMQRSQMLWKGSILVQNVIKADWTYLCVKNSQANLVATPLNSENILAFEPEVSSILKYMFLNVCRYFEICHKILRYMFEVWRYLCVTNVWNMSQNSRRYAMKSLKSMDT